METHVRVLEELGSEAARFVSTLAPHTNHATVVLLSGDLGAGKTAFTKEIARALGVDEVVNSPTFVLEKIYSLDAAQDKQQTRGFSRLIHIDAYRLEGREELAPLAFEEFLRDPENLIIVEWPEQVGLTELSPATLVSIERLPDESRTITYG